MKNRMLSLMLLILFPASTLLKAQENPEGALGLPGDNLNLYAVMKLFQESQTLEAFERGLNDENQTINNLDLNADNYIDYITVTDNVDGNVHNIVLQVPVNEKEKQDVAVFTVEKLKDGNVVIQLTGDEALYGKDYIIEPNYSDTKGETPNPGYTGNNNVAVTVVPTTTVEVAAWPVVTYIYAPVYVPWYSSWHWGYYPPWWRPWRPYSWHYYYGFHSNWHYHYHGYYRPTRYHYSSHYRTNYYVAHRSTSVNVNVNIQQNRYRTSYSHPDDRARGQADFERKNPEIASRRNSVNPAGNVSAGRGQAQQTGSRDATVSSSDRRSNTSTGNRAADNNRSEVSSGSRRDAGNTASGSSRDKSSSTSARTRESGSTGSSTNAKSSTSSSRSSGSSAKSSSSTGKSSGTASQSRSSGSNQGKSSGSGSQSKSSGTSSQSKSSSESKRR
jgi:hypothetical protein